MNRTSGAILDVVVDSSPGSPTFLRHVAVELSAGRGPAVVEARAIEAAVDYPGNRRLGEPTAGADE